MGKTQSRWRGQSKDGEQVASARWVQITRDQSNPADAKLCLVTGASAGLGRATASRLAGMEAHVVMVCHDRARGEAARDEIKSQSKNESVDLMLETCPCWPLFAVSLPNSEQNTRSWTSDQQRCRRSEQSDSDARGFEQMFATNYLGGFLLTRPLIPYLEAARPSRIINVTAPSTTRPNLDDLRGERKFSSLGAFGASKAADLLFTYALARRLGGRGITANAYHPGIMKTNLNRTAPTPIRLVAGVLNRLAGATPERASEGLVQLATSVQFADTNGQLMHGGKAMTAPFIGDKDLQDSLWKASCSLARVQETI